MVIPFFFLLGRKLRHRQDKEVARQRRAGMYSQSLSPPPVDPLSQGSYRRMDLSASVVH